MTEISLATCYLARPTADLSDCMGEVIVGLDFDDVVTLHRAGGDRGPVAATLRPGITAAYHRQLDALDVPAMPRPSDLRQLAHLARARHGERCMQEAVNTWEVEVGARLSSDDPFDLSADFRARATALHQLLLRQYRGCTWVPDLNLSCLTVADQAAVLGHFRQLETLALTVLPGTLAALASTAAGLTSLTLRERDNGRYLGADCTDDPLPLPIVGADLAALPLGPTLTALDLDLDLHWAGSRPGLLRAIAALPGLVDFNCDILDLFATAEDRDATASLAPRLRSFRAATQSIVDGPLMATLPFSSSLVHLDLHTFVFPEVPATLRGCSRLQSLRLVQSALTALPPWLPELRALTSLDVAHQMTDMFPHGLQLPFHVPVWLPQCASLLHLNIDTAPLVGTEHLGGLGMTSLHLPNLPTAALAPLLAQLTALEVLHITAWDQDLDFDVGVLALPRLRAICLSPHVLEGTDSAAAHELMHVWRARPADEDGHVRYERPASSC